MSKHKYKISILMYSAVVASVLNVENALAEASFKPILPMFGGQNGQALTVLQFEKGMRDAKQAKIDAAIREQERLDAIAANQKSPADKLIDALTSQLQYRLASQFADEILNDTTGGDLTVGTTTISYSQVDGILTITISEEGEDSVTIELPTVN